jgi:hypothetical protein
MDNRVIRLAAFTEVIVAQQLDRFEQAVKAAYAVGARHSDLLTAVDIAKALAAVPAKVLARAYRAVNDWQWMEARAVAQQQEAVSQAS